jgi:hypothetical protein
MRAPRSAALAGLILIAAAACAPNAPKGVSKDALDQAVSRAIGDPATCVLIAEQPSGKVVYRYSYSHVACARSLPACDGSGTRTVDQLLAATQKDGLPRTLSCVWPNDPSKGISWASGPVPGKALTYAALMEGQRALPGRMIAERLDDAFKSTGVEPAR